MRLKHSRALACALVAAWAAALFGPGAAPAGAQGGAEPRAAEFVSAAELKEKLTRGQPVTLIDLRSANAYASSDGKVSGAIHIKERRLRARLALPPLRDLARDASVVTYCACPDDEAAVRAAQTLAAAGFKRVRVLKGGWRAWLDAGGPVEAKPRGM
jgi:rhodanese-related sulfurtransferase